ncbi:MAG: polyprenyl synthetase family protein [Oscillospiraceae bacterium]|nr:polyprenyl synthetase family protein [Oscillospiraceae bacterium]
MKKLKNNKIKNNKLFLDKYQEYKDLVNNRLEKIIDKNDESCVAQAMRYSLNIGGKRIRPVLTLAFCESCFGFKQEALDIACAIEMIHTYSLIHDDLPCMDDDNFRRGWPACHIKFGQAIALLAGDGLLTDAFNLISKSNIEPSIKINIIKILSEATGSKKMIFGQELDINKKTKTSSKILDKINKLKTCELIKASAVLGCLVAKTNKNKILAASRFGEALGLAFQIKDDIIDVTGRQEIIGKPVMSDKNNGKLTYVDLIGESEAEKKVEELSKEAINILKKEFEGKIDFLIDLTNFLLNRES